jgi:hypothetical protein
VRIRSPIVTGSWPRSRSSFSVLGLTAPLNPGARSHQN